MADVRGDGFVEQRAVLADHGDPVAQVVQAISVHGHCRRC
jgi:hypothetical protein